MSRNTLFTRRSVLTITAVLITVVVSLGSLEAFDKRTSCERAADWIGNEPLLPETIDELYALPVAYRSAAFRAASAEKQSELMRAHLTRYADNTSLTPAQRDSVKLAISYFSAEVFRNMTKTAAGATVMPIGIEVVTTAQKAAFGADVELRKGWSLGKVAHRASANSPRSPLRPSFRVTAARLHLLATSSRFFNFSGEEDPMCDCMNNAGCNTGDFCKTDINCGPITWDCDGQQCIGECTPVPVDGTR